MTGLLNRVLLLGIAVLAGLVLAVPAESCPFCSMQGQTLTGDVAQASMVLYGTFKKPNGDAATGEGKTDLEIESVIKRPADKDLDKKVLGDRKVITLSRYVEQPEKMKYLVFCDIFKGNIDPYRGVAVKADSDMPKYLQGALAVKDEKVGKRLRFFFDYLDNADIEISNDAYKEFANADYKDYRDMAKSLPADRIVRWLKDPKTPEFRIGLYASMLGHCGREQDAALLRSLLDDPAKRVTSGVDGILAGYTMLKPKEGWAYTRDLLKDPKKEFLLRYAALRAARFLWEFRPDLIDRKELAQGVAQLLDQSDIADLAIEDLRKWQAWDMTDRILNLRGKAPYEVPIVRRSILRFALSNKDSKAAASYVAEQRKKDPDAVADAEELLKLEQAQPAPQAPAPTASK
jgi:hypothetical protein